MVVPPSPNIDVVAAVKARFKIQRLQVLFMGKPPAEVTAFCNRYTDPEFPMFSDKMIPIVEDALLRLDEWKARRRAEQK